MNIIPTISETLKGAYTVVGGKNFSKEHKFLSSVSIVLLNRGGRYLRSSIFKELESLSVGEIISVECMHPSFDVEQLTAKYSNLRFILFKENVTVGEMINAGIEEALGEYVMVLWNDMNLGHLSISSRVFEKISENKLLCTIPIIENSEKEIIPTIASPAYYNRFFKVLHFMPTEDGCSSLYPFDYCGVYHKEKFQQIGGFDYSMKNPYWQKLDFGFRVYMCGEVIGLKEALHIRYAGEIEPEDTTPDHDYLLFYLKNLALKVRNEKGVIPFWVLISYLFKSSGNFISSMKEFKEARKWVDRYNSRFVKDSQTITNEWRIPGE